MIEALAWFPLAATVILLAVGLYQQFTTVGPRGALLDRLAIAPQWKFFGQSDIRRDPAWFDDVCLLARISPDPDTPGEWHNVLWWGERSLGLAIWNPSLRRKDAIGEAMVALIKTEPLAASRAEPIALAYLTILRLCLERMPPGQGEAVQFAITTTRGRGERPVFLHLLSAWHSP